MVRAALICLFCILQATAAPLVIKDDFRSPRNKERRLRKATTLVVLHTTEAHAKSSLNKLSERGEAHYCVVENGTVYRIIDRDREAFHAGRSMWNGKEDCDTYAIGIEVVGHHDQAVTLQQLDALKETRRLSAIRTWPTARRTRGTRRSIAAASGAACCLRCPAYARSSASRRVLPRTRT